MFQNLNQFPTNISLVAWPASLRFRFSSSFAAFLASASSVSLVMYQVSYRIGVYLARFSLRTRQESYQSSSEQRRQSTQQILHSQILILVLITTTATAAGGCFILIAVRILGFAGIANGRGGTRLWVLMVRGCEGILGAADGLADSMALKTNKSRNKYIDYFGGLQLGTRLDAAFIYHLIEATVRRPESGWSKKTENRQKPDESKKHEGHNLTTHRTPAANAAAGAPAPVSFCWPRCTPGGRTSANSRSTYSWRFGPNSGRSSTNASTIV